MRHTTDPICPLCEEKLKKAHPLLVSWFREVKTRFPAAHISCSYRGKEDQEMAFKEGKSHAQFPHSKHNSELGDIPCSRALDLFELREGKAYFERGFYTDIEFFTAHLSYEINWGGHFKSLHDYPHFELE